MQRTSGSLIEWLIPLGFILCGGWAIWHIPVYLLTWFPHENESMLAQVTAISDRNDVTPNLAPLFGKIDIIDLIAIVMLPILFIIGCKTVRRANMEFADWRAVDRGAMFIGRVTMMMIILMTGVMLYEVFLRYVLERPTLWANELSLWLAGFIFLMAGLYAMQQRSHIRIFLLYDVCPRWLQRTFDCINTGLIVLFAFFLVYGSYKQVFENKLYKWETFGTAFDPPIPATLQPLVLIIITLVAMQAVLNLISDWNAEPEIHDDTPDEDEIEALKRAVGQD
ncbi:MAG: TRAP transporter small permease subunit [Roseobacter sp.]